MDYAVFPTSLGWMLIAGSHGGITRVVLPAPDESTALARLCLQTRTTPRELYQRGPSFFGTIADRLAAYMCGDQMTFPDAVDRTAWTEFQSRVWDATRQIGYGETRSYAWVAAAAGQPRASRAVGQALHNNPVPIIVPCHRVIGTDGSLTGFGGGLEMKRRLLLLESGAHAASVDAICTVNQYAGEVTLELGT